MSKGDEDAKIFVGNISYNTRERELEELFKEYGHLTECRVAVETSTGRSKGFAFITMDNAKDAQEAIRQLNGHQVDGRTIKVENVSGRSGGGGRNGYGRGDERFGRDRGDRGGRDYDRGRDREDRGRDYDRNDRGRDRDSGRRNDRYRDRPSDRQEDRGRDTKHEKVDERDNDRQRRDRSRDGY